MLASSFDLIIWEGQSACVDEEPSRKSGSAEINADPLAPGALIMPASALTTHALFI